MTLTILGHLFFATLSVSLFIILKESYKLYKNKICEPI